MKRLFPVMVVWAMTACSGGGDPAPAADPAAPAAGEAAPAAPTEAAPAAPAAPAADAAASTWTVTGANQGDIACYVDLTSEAGETKTFPSDFEFCPGASKDLTPLVGKKASVTFEKIKVQSAECQGDPECTKSEEVEGVKTVTAL